jgi:hypothetical protein
MKHRLFDDPAVSKMLDNDALQKGRRHSMVPDALRVHHQHRAAGADPEARRLTAFHPVRPEQESFTLKQRRQQTIQLGAAPVGRTEAAHADEYVMAVGVHRWSERAR